MKLLGYILFFLSLISLSSCNRPWFNTLPLEYNTKERQDLAKSFAENFYSKCDKKDYSEIQGFNIDVNMNRHFSSEKIEKICKSSQERLGKINIGNLYSAKTRAYPSDYLDFFEFYVTTEKNDSIRYLRIGLTRDKDYFNTFLLTKSPLTKYRKKSKSIK